MISKQTFRKNLYRILNNKIFHNKSALVGDDQSRDIRIMMLGLCQLETIVDPISFVNSKVQHKLYGFRRGETLPSLPDGTEVVLISIPIRNIIKRMLNDDRPASDMLFARIDNDARAGEYLLKCAQEIDEILRNCATAYPDTLIISLSFFESRLNYQGELIERHSRADPRNFMHDLNGEMEKLTHKYNNIRYLESNDILDFIGRAGLQDDLYMNQTHGSFRNDFNDLDGGRFTQILRKSLNRTLFEVKNWQFSSRLLDKVVTIYKTHNTPGTIKLAIVDIDDTLWRGVAADSDDILEDDLIEGWPLGFIEALLFFKRRGGLLALASKNDETETKDRFDRIFRGALTFEDFAAISINWRPKSENITAILKRVNLLPANAVFIDDNPREHDEVSRLHPALLHLTTNQRSWREFILNHPTMQVDVLTDEARNRTEMVRASGTRAALLEGTSSGVNREEWLEGLKITLSVSTLKDKTSTHYDRAFELLNKTNQFNTNGHRWTRQEFELFLRSGGNFWVIGARDKFTNNGVVSIVATRDHAIIQMVLSCRVFGLGVEDAIIAHVTNFVLETHDRVAVRVLETGKNATCLDVFGRLGFSGGPSDFERETKLSLPHYIQIG